MKRVLVAWVAAHATGVSTSLGNPQEEIPTSENRERDGYIRNSSLKTKSDTGDREFIEAHAQVEIGEAPCRVPVYLKSSS